jgi:hypothetical protein
MEACWRVEVTGVLAGGAELAGNAELDSGAKRVGVGVTWVAVAYRAGGRRRPWWRRGSGESRGVDLSIHMDAFHGRKLGLVGITWEQSKAARKTCGWMQCRKRAGSGEFF